MKDSLRKKLIKKRNSIENREEKSFIIYLNLKDLDIWKRAEITHIYISFGSEVDTRFIIYHALAENKKVLCPIINEKDLLVGEIKSFNDLIPGPYGILQPKISINFDLEKIDVIIVPGVAFDKEGFRLGYGKGFYDRFLAKLKKPIKIGLIYDELIIDSLPRNEEDIPVDIIISEKRIIYTKNY
ncbi:MAG: 5-formyltetrahydrofolate cyclo-ligase [Dictyoglomus sp.]|nr:5-formyltetrahydrofolate cyclo-ligase [Dictyoglomus sp.]MCX7942228.1 5-formyltetrahydrofolate cyclo-ligase [Dictyoglomaceae bacterium]MDW8188691.1 5-formyltetrahydrofolate cyclo-ligase [Dictyoglomus sp.]